MAVRAASVRRLALALPESAEAPHHDMTSFRVAGKIFATMPADERHLHVFLDREAVSARCAAHPDAVEELWWGSRMSGCRVTLGATTTALVRELLTESWRRRAPRRVLAAFDRE
jgi:hypothetical protein